MAKAKLTPKKSSGVVVNRQASIAESRKVKKDKRVGPRTAAQKKRANIAYNQTQNSMMPRTPAQMRRVKLAQARAKARAGGKKPKFGSKKPKAGGGGGG